MKLLGLPLRTLALHAGVLLGVLLPAIAHAQDAAPQPADVVLTPAQTQGLSQQPPTIAAPSTTTVPSLVPVTPRTEVEAQVDRFAEFDALRPQGQTTDFPGTYDTLLGDDGGWRSWLYDHDMYMKVVSVSSLTDNVLSESGPRRPQEYLGQRLSLATNNAVRFSWKLGGSGLDITQLNICFEDNVVSWDQIGPTGADFLRLDLYSSFFNRRVEVTGGFGGNILNYVGIFAGGNPILANGLAGTIPIEAGMSAGSAGTPLLNVQLNGDDGYYSKSGIQRSLGTDGLISEAKQNGVGLELTRKGAEPLFIEELGLLRPASPNGRQIWLRMGGFYNMTEYNRFDGLGTSRNWAAYILGDYQVYKASVREPYRGVFIGASALFAPENVNVYTRTYEARAYAIGMLPGRATDSATMTLDYNDFSKPANTAFATAYNLLTERYQWSASFLYAMHLVRGVYLAPSITYLRHPSFIGDYKPALNLTTALTVQF